MPDYYLRIEAVNMGFSIYDTNDLSTIRGGGLLALQAPEGLLASVPGLTRVSVGASSGLFRFAAETPEAANAVLHSARQHLRQGDCRHLSFVCDIHRYDNNASFQHNERSVLAKNRWQQLQAPSFPWPHVNGGVATCAYDGFRPAQEGARVKKRAASSSVIERRQFGRAQKHLLYGPGAETAAHFESLAHDPSRGKANDKLAVLYIDGNKFSRFNKDAKEEDDLKAFDTFARDKRKALLTQLISGLRNPVAEPPWQQDWCTVDPLPDPDPDPDPHTVTEMKDGAAAGHLRLETLLWGGDEIVWVVPAWQGLELLHWFFTSTANWTHDAQKLTHSAGLVFCHHHAPIARVKDFAKSLAELCKTTLKTFPGESLAHNAFACAVLESFDAPTSSAAQYLGRLSHPPDALAPAGWVLSPDWLAQLRQSMKDLREADALPARRLHAATTVALRGGNVDKAMADFLGACAVPAREALENLMGRSNSTAAHWKQPPAMLPVLLNMLWDYADFERLTPLTPLASRGSTP